MSYIYTFIQNVLSRSEAVASAVVRQLHRDGRSIMGRLVNFKDPSRIEQVFVGRAESL